MTSKQKGIADSWLLRVQINKSHVHLSKAARACPPRLINFTELSNFARPILYYGILSLSGGSKEEEAQHVYTISPEFNLM